MNLWVRYKWMVLWWPTTITAVINSIHFLLLVSFVHSSSLYLSVCLRLQHLPLGWLHFHFTNGTVACSKMQTKSKNKKKLHANWMVIYILTLMRFAVAIAPAATVAILYVWFFFLHFSLLTAVKPKTVLFGHDKSKIQMKKKEHS